MRSLNASTMAGSMASNPCSRYTAAIAASSTAARTFRLREIRCSSSRGASPANSSSRSPRPSSFATAAQLCRDTTCARTFARRPSDAPAKRSNTARAIASSRTLSPRNSSRSYESKRSSTHDVCVNTCSRRSAGSSTISRPSSAGPCPTGSASLEPSSALVRDDVVDRLADGRELASVLVRNLEPELVFEVHDDLHEIERVGTEIFLEGRLFGDLALVDAELLAQRALELFEDLLTRSRHARNLTSLPSGSWSAPMLTRQAPCAPGGDRPPGARLHEPRDGSRWRSQPASSSRVRSRRGR